MEVVDTTVAVDHKDIYTDTSIWGGKAGKLTPSYNTNLKVENGSEPYEIYFAEEFSSLSSTPKIEGQTWQGLGPRGTRHCKNCPGQIKKI